jgi:hypothetical protein
MGEKMRASTTLILIAVAALVSCQSIVDAFPDSEKSDQKPTLVTEPAAGSASFKWKKEYIDTTGTADYLTEVEKQVIIEINMLRTNPAQHSINYVEPLRKYYKGRLFQRPGEIAIQTTGTL